LTSSSTRDDLLLDQKTLQRMWIMRKYLSDMNPVEAMSFINDRFKQTKNNEEF
jgi:transcription termination factor Rho